MMNKNIFKCSVATIKVSLRFFHSSTITCTKIPPFESYIHSCTILHRVLLKSMLLRGGGCLSAALQTIWHANHRLCVRKFDLTPPITYYRRGFFCFLCFLPFLSDVKVYTNCSMMFYHLQRETTFLTGYCSPFKIGSILKRKNLLLMEQILFFKSRPLMRGVAKMKIRLAAFERIPIYLKGRIW